ncbi:unnamed protein product [Moneuplotes crassus]|uniref:Uncharacterized protein n=1 Tax=Euplotes crassus TaxID=5936 RepID=A0AAD1YA26_EUPCR|nr:unnamed protein product [Moneuplotes crassus]
MKAQQEKEKDYLNRNLPYETPYINFSMRHAIIKKGKESTKYKPRSRIHKMLSDRKRSALDLKFIRNQTFNPIVDHNIQLQKPETITLNINNKAQFSESDTADYKILTPSFKQGIKTLLTISRSMKDMIEHTKKKAYPQKTLTRDVIMKPVRSKNFSQQISMIKSRTITKKATENLEKRLLRNILMHDRTGEGFVKRLFSPVLKTKGKGVKEVSEKGDGRNLDLDLRCCVHKRSESYGSVSKSEVSWAPSPQYTPDSKRSSLGFKDSPKNKLKPKNIEKNNSIGFRIDSSCMKKVEASSENTNRKEIDKKNKRLLASSADYSNIQTYKRQRPNLKPYAHGGPIVHNSIDDCRATIRTTKCKKRIKYSSKCVKTTQIKSVKKKRKLKKMKNISDNIFGSLKLFISSTNEPRESIKTRTQQLSKARKKKVSCKRKLSIATSSLVNTRTRGNSYYGDSCRNSTKNKVISSPLTAVQSSYVSSYSIIRD